jgi:glycosyltransferase involved in cell wall biosynthesis
MFRVSCNGEAARRMFRIPRRMISTEAATTLHQSRLPRGTQQSGLIAGHGQVLIVCPGGLENGGGIGRQMAYFLGALDPAASPPRYTVMDSRGPWFLGASRKKSILSVFYLAACAARLVIARTARERALAHINITGRGSTFRKLAIVAAANIVGLRYLLHVHDYDYAADYAGRGKRLQSLVRCAFQGAERVIVLGARDKTNLQNALHLSPSKVMVLHNAVPDPQPSDAWHDADDTVRLLFLGYLSERKGVSDLLQALASDIVRSLDWQMTVAGGGDLDLYRSKAVSLGLADRIVFPGWLDRPAAAEACRQTDILVLPSYAEGLAMAVLEGLSYGLVVITTPVGAHTEVIEEGISGLMLPPGDIPALATALARTIADPGLRRKLQRGARDRFLEKFEAHAYSARLAALHAQILADARK